MRSRRASSSEMVPTVVWSSVPSMIPASAVPDHAGVDWLVEMRLAWKQNPKSTMMRCSNPGLIPAASASPSPNSQGQRSDVTASSVPYSERNYRIVRILTVIIKHPRPDEQHLEFRSNTESF